MLEKEIKKFANRLKWYRRSFLKINQVDIAKFCNISHREWVRIENGEQLPDFNILLKLVELGADMNYLFDAHIIRLSQREEQMIVKFRQATFQGQMAMECVADSIQKKTREELETEENFFENARKIHDMIVHRGDNFE